uniref:Adhesion G protein-coupled receptor E8 n=1 Tax=Takifugu rubripes TaxID=31033 RepID=A0A3B5KG55_TAKRU
MPKLSDIDECKQNGICGQTSYCTNIDGGFHCTCFIGYRATDSLLSADDDECLANICGDNGACLNNNGSFTCTCNEGYYVAMDARPVCQDIDECMNSTVCGPESTCTNTPGSFTCACNWGWESNVCIDVGECVEFPTICGPKSNCTNLIGSYNCTCNSGYRLNNLEVIASVTNPYIDECAETPGICGRNTVCTNVPGTFFCSCPDGFYPSTGILWLVGTSFCKSKQNNPAKLLKKAEMLLRSATVAILTLNGMESLLSHQYFRTVNRTEMNSDVFTVLLPTKIPENGIVTCVYWEVGEGGQSSGEKRWSTDGCWISFAHENYTVCSCSHLSTFALIMQIPAPANPFLDWLNRVCVIVGLFFFGLAIFTFLLCSWNPKINNTARLHLCLNLSMSHLLLLWNQEYTENELACTVMAGLLHFLVIASFVWMLLEALQLHLLVRRLTKVQVIQRDGLPRPLLYLIGYGVPFTIVGVSALVYSDGYGATEAKMCWLSERRKFNWALTGPVIAILGVSQNCVKFVLTVFIIPKNASVLAYKSTFPFCASSHPSLILFKIVAQFVILGCTWILGLYQTNLFFQVLFIILNSQQGTFLFIVHCLLNKEVRDEYIKWLTCTCGKDITVVSPWKLKQSPYGVQPQKNWKDLCDTEKPFCSGRETLPRSLRIWTNKQMMEKKVEDQ